MSPRRIVMVAAILGALAVAVGAFGAHLLPTWLARQELTSEQVERRQRSLDVGARYHMYHALALVGVGLAAQVWTQDATRIAAGFLIGMLLFSGNLYLYALTGIRWLQAIVPLGGALTILSWLAWAWKLAKVREP